MQIETKEARRRRLNERRARQLARTPGFTPIRNVRVSKAVQATALIFQIQGKSAIDAQNAAWDHVAKSLPRAAMVKSHRPRPSKSDSPEYRKTQCQPI